MSCFSHGQMLKSLSFANGENKLYRTVNYAAGRFHELVREVERIFICLVGLAVVAGAGLFQEEDGETADVCSPIVFMKRFTTNAPSLGGYAWLSFKAIGSPVTSPLLPILTMLLCFLPGQLHLVCKVLTQSCPMNLYRFKKRVPNLTPGVKAQRTQVLEHALNSSTTFATSGRRNIMLPDGCSITGLTSISIAKA